MLNENVLDATIKALELRKEVLLAVPVQDDGLKLDIEQTERALLLMQALNRGDAIASLWWTDDVYSLVEGDGDEEPSVKLTQAEARAVLAAAESNHDAEQGINWDTLRCHLDDVLAERDEDPNGGDGDDD